MKGFNFKEFISKIKEVYNAVSGVDFENFEASAVSNLGYNYALLLDSPSINKMKEMYLEAQQQKTADDFLMATSSNTIWALEENLSSATIEVINMLVDGQMENLDWVDPNKNLKDYVNAIVNIKMFNQDKKEISNQLMKLVNEYVKKGYNIYPLMQQCFASQEFNTRIDKENNKDNIVANELAQNILSISDKSHSPYLPLFNRIQKLGELINLSKEFGKKEDYKQQEQVDNKILELQDNIIQVAKQYDLDYLEMLLKDKQKYLELQGANDIYSAENDMFAGLQKARNLIHFENKREKQTKSDKTL